MNIQPDYCEKCKAAGVIAAKNGPTCTHSLFNWPDDFAKMTEGKRVEWVWANRTKTK